MLALGVCSFKFAAWNKEWILYGNTWTRIEISFTCVVLLCVASLSSAMPLAIVQLALYNVNTWVMNAAATMTTTIITTEVAATAH